MRFPIISSLLLAAFAGTAFFMDAYGWSFLSETAPSVSTYRKTVETVLDFCIGVSVIALASGVGIRLLEKAFERVLRGSALARKLLPLLKYVMNALVWGFGTFFLLSTLGVNVSALLTGAGIGGLAFALASKEIASNLFGSLSLIFGKFFKISDRIRIKGFEGTVEEITLSHTRLTDKSGHTVFVPNKFLTAEPIENLSEAAAKTAEISIVLRPFDDIDACLEAAAKLPKKLSGAKLKFSVTETGVDAVKGTLKIETDPELLDETRRTVAKNVANFLKSEAVA